MRRGGGGRAVSCGVYFIGVIDVGRAGKARQGDDSGRM